ncbi:MAG: hypothetical protein IPM69_09395 [Ignavibacteria bacterium]|nr:hypothetical protein [Ignavibacteria bacterium]
MKTFLFSLIFALLVSSTIVVAQGKSEKSSTTIKTDKRTDSVYYTCSKHHVVKLNQKGKCPMCGAILDKKTVRTTEIKTEKHEAMDSYVCPMHHRVKSHKPGKCPKCGMDLVKKD